MSEDSGNKNILAFIGDSISYSPIGINEAGDPCVGGPNQIDAVLDGPEDAHGKDLVRNSALSKPGLIAYIHNELGSLCNKRSRKVRKQNFPANESSKLSSINPKKG